VPGSNWFAQMASKTMPMVIAEFYGWLDYPDYFFFWTYDGANNSVFDSLEVSLRIWHAVIFTIQSVMLPEPFSVTPVPPEPADPACDDPNDGTHHTHHV
jgi:hypothetical protein